MGFCQICGEETDSLEDGVSVCEECKIEMEYEEEIEFREHPRKDDSPECCIHWYDYSEPPHLEEWCRAVDKPCACCGQRERCEYGHFEPIRGGPDLSAEI